MFIEFLLSRFKDIEIKGIVSDIMDTDSPKEIEKLITELIDHYFKSNIKTMFFMEPSAGVVFGFLLSSGDKITLKVFNKKISRKYLEEMNRIQNIYYTEGYPAPKVLSPLIELNNTHAGFYEFIEGNKEDGHDSDIRHELAKYLAKFSEIADKHQFEFIYSFMQLSAEGKLWPKSHNILFDFKNTSRGAGWIANRAIAAKRILKSDRSNKRLAHTDWDVKNTIFKHKKLVGVFDWDALGTMSESEMVGRACAQFTADWKSGNKVTPTPEEARQFVEAYEEYRGRAFTKDEYHILSASADYLIAMIARFEHAGGDSVIHPYQDLLRECDKKSFLFI